MAYTYQVLEKWPLVDIRKKSDESLKRTLYIYTYFEVYQDKEKQLFVSDIGVITVVQHDLALFTIFRGSQPIRTFNKDENNYWDHKQPKKAENAAESNQSNTTDESNLQNEGSGTNGGN